MTIQDNFNVITSLLPVLLIIWTGRVEGHGRLLEPPSRGSMWRLGYDTPKDYADNQLFCGGFAHQVQNGGKCGICGDPYDGVRQHEAGGMYATGTIVRHYSEGQKINIKIQITANHQGWFEFRLCPNNNPRKAATQQCLDRFLLRKQDGSTRYQLTSKGPTYVSLQLSLPRGLTCTQCVLQWRWNAGNSWRCDAEGCGLGRGAQEQFYGCADVSISGAGGGYQSAPLTKAPIVSVPHYDKPKVPYLGGVPQNTFIQGHITQQVLHPGYYNTKAPIVSVHHYDKPPVPYSGGVHPGYYNTGGYNIFTGPVSTSNPVCAATPQGRSQYFMADIWCQRQCAVNNCNAYYCNSACMHMMGR